MCSWASSCANTLTKHTKRIAVAAVTTALHSRNFWIHYLTRNFRSGRSPRRRQIWLANNPSEISIRQLYLEWKFTIQQTSIQLQSFANWAAMVEENSSIKWTRRYILSIRCNIGFSSEWNAGTASDCDVLDGPAGLEMMVQRDFSDRGWNLTEQNELQSW